VSADTARAAPARAALEAGARVINDVAGLRDGALARLVVAHGAGVIAMAAPGPEPVAGGPVETVEAGLAAILARARAAGIDAGRVVLDPGIGFFRTAALPWYAWDVAVLAGLPRLAALGRPLCVGVSRKSFIGAITGRRSPAGRLAGSLAATAAAVLGGAAVIRTHDVAETVDAVRVAERVREGRA
jgi:dihydropteroate synthase